MERIRRRDFIRAGMIAVSGAAVLRAPYSLFAAGRKGDWEMPEEARVAFASGEVTVNGEKAGVGRVLTRGDTVRTGGGSEALIEVRDYAAFNVRENTTVRLIDILSRPEIEVVKGWFLIIVKRGTPVNLRTSTAFAGIRGTVLFVNVLGVNSSYICVCNGKVELADPRSMRTLDTFSSSYHTAVNVGTAGGSPAVAKAGLLYHSDDDILAMAGRFRRETAVFRTRKALGTTDERY